MLTGTEEHIVLLEEPGSKYLGHVTLPLESSTAEVTFEAIRDHFQVNLAERLLLKNSIISSVVGCTFDYEKFILNRQRATL